MMMKEILDGKLCGIRGRDFLYFLGFLALLANYSVVEVLSRAWNGDLVKAGLYLCAFAIFVFAITTCSYYYAILLVVFLVLLPSYGYYQDESSYSQADVRSVLKATDAVHGAEILIINYENGNFLLIESKNEEDISCRGKFVLISRTLCRKIFRDIKSPV